MYINGFTRESVMKQIRSRNLGFPSYDENGQQCMYRAHNGNQCLVGCFIPDNLYEEDFEGESSHIIYDKMPDKMPIVRPMLRRLQEYHDEYIYEYRKNDNFLREVELELISLEKEWEEKWLI